MTRKSPLPLRWHIHWKAASTSVPPPISTVPAVVGVVTSVGFPSRKYEYCLAQNPGTVKQIAKVSVRMIRMRASQKAENTSYFSERLQYESTMKYGHGGRELQGSSYLDAYSEFLRGTAPVWRLTFFCPLLRPARSTRQAAAERPSEWANPIGICLA